MTKKIFISAGDYSGNLIGADLLKLLYERYPDADFMGIGGDEMCRTGFVSISAMRDTAVSGFVSVIKKIVYFRRLYVQARSLLTQHRWDMVILIDFPGFNMRLVDVCKRSKIPVYYIAPPQVWAWKKNRIHAFKGVRVQTIFEFEHELYTRIGAEVHYAGHPVIDRIVERSADRVRDRILLLPGSRKCVVLSNAQSFVYAAKKLQAALAVPAPIQLVLPQFLADDSDVRAAFSGIEMCTHMQEAIGSARFAIAVPGTNNMELLAASIPALIMYQAGFVNYALARFFLTIPYVSAVNMLADREVFPEFVFWRKASMSKFVSFAVQNIVLNEKALRAELTILAENTVTVSGRQGGSGFALCAADAIGEYIDG